MKNITVSVDDELFNKMRQRKEINWSAVARACLEAFISGDITITHSKNGIKVRQNPEVV